MKYLIPYTLVLIIILQTFTLFKLRNKYKEKFYKYNVKVNKMIYEIEKISELESLDIGKRINVSSLQKINDCFRITDSAFTKKNIYLRIPEKYCSTCVNNYIDKLSTLSSKIDKNMFFVLTKKQDSLMLYYYKRRYPLLKDNIINIDSLPIKIEQQNKPYILTIDDNNYIRDVHILNKNLKNRSVFYINGLINYYDRD